MWKVFAPTVQHGSRSLNCDIVCTNSAACCDQRNWLLDHAIVPCGPCSSQRAPRGLKLRPGRLTRATMQVLITVLINGGACYYLLRHWKLSGQESGDTTDHEMAAMLTHRSSDTPSGGQLQQNGLGSPTATCSTLATGTSRCATCLPLPRAPGIVVLSRCA